MLPEVTVTEALDIIETVMSAQNVYNPTTIAALHHARRALAENVDLRAALARAEQTAGVVWWVCDDSGENAWGRDALWATLDQAKAAGIAAFLAEDPDDGVTADELSWRLREAAKGACWDLYRDGSMTNVEIWRQEVQGQKALAADVPAAADKANLCGSCDAGLPMSCTCPDVPATDDEKPAIEARDRCLNCGHAIYQITVRGRKTWSHDYFGNLLNCPSPSPAVLPPTPNDDNGEGEAASC